MTERAKQTTPRASTAPTALTGLFRDAALLEEALTHRSYANEHPDKHLADNQRLEFLGDAVLSLIVGEWLFLRYPHFDEGSLTSARACIVCTETLAHFAREINLGNYLRMGRGEAATGGRERDTNLCAAFEALVGALYLDAGLEATRRWLEPFLAHAEELINDGALHDPKSQLQELAQRDLHLTPFYRIVREEGPDHYKTFTAEVLLGKDVWGTGQGNSKQAAEQAAARAALKRYADAAPTGDN